MLLLQTPGGKDLTFWTLPHAINWYQLIVYGSVQRLQKTSHYGCVEPL